VNLVNINKPLNITKSSLNLVIKNMPPIYGRASDRFILKLV